MENPTKWLDDHHKIVLVFYGEEVRLQTICPLDRVTDEDKIEMIRLQKTDCAHMPAGECIVRNELDAHGLSANFSGLGIMVRGEVPIEYGWLSEEELVFKVSGYPSEADVRRFRKEITVAILGENRSILNPLEIPEEILSAYALRPWAEIDDEAKIDLKEEIERYLQEKERRRNERRQKTAAKSGS